MFLGDGCASVHSNIGYAREIHQDNPGLFGPEFDGRDANGGRIRCDGQVSDFTYIVTFLIRGHRRNDFLTGNLASGIGIGVGSEVMYERMRRVDAAGKLGL